MNEIDTIGYAIAVEDRHMTHMDAVRALLIEARENGHWVGVDLDSALKAQIQTLRTRRANGLPDYPTQDELDDAQAATDASVRRQAAAAAMGRARSDAKTTAARQNGRLGGRPRKQ
jgi:hypothetical protein